MRALARLHDIDGPSPVRAGRGRAEHRLAIAQGHRTARLGRAHDRSRGLVGQAARTGDRHRRRHPVFHHHEGGRGRPLIAGAVAGQHRRAGEIRVADVEVAVAGRVGDRDGDWCVVGAVEIQPGDPEVGRVLPGLHHVSEAQRCGGGPSGVVGQGGAVAQRQPGQRAAGTRDERNLGAGGEGDDLARGEVRSVRNGGQGGHGQGQRVGLRLGRCTPLSESRHPAPVRGEL